MEQFCLNWVSICSKLKSTKTSSKRSDTWIRWVLLLTKIQIKKFSNFFFKVGISFKCWFSSQIYQVLQGRVKKGVPNPRVKEVNPRPRMGQSTAKTLLQIWFHKQSQVVLIKLTSHTPEGFENCTAPTIGIIQYWKPMECKMLWKKTFLLSKWLFWKPEIMGNLMQIKIPLLPPTVDQSPSTSQQLDQCFSLARMVAKLESRDLAAMLAAKLILKTPLSSSSWES